MTQINLKFCKIHFALMIMLLAFHANALADNFEFFSGLERRSQEFREFKVEWKIQTIEAGRQPTGFTVYEMVVENDCFRITRNVQGMKDPMRGSPTSFQQTFTDNGAVQYNFICDFADTQNTPTGNRSFNAVTGKRFAADDDVLPLLLYFRPSAVRLHQFDAGSATVSILPGGEIEVLSTTGHHRTVWQSSEPFQLRQWEFAPPQQRPDTNRWKTTIDYGLSSEIFGDPDRKTIPIAFRVIHSSPTGEVIWVKHAQVTAFTSRPIVTKSTFVINFPEGTPVINGDNPEQKFVVRSDGTFRPVSAGDAHQHSNWLEVARAPVDVEVAHLEERRRSWIYFFAGTAVVLVWFAKRRLSRS
jgi:hypothetical protein